MDSLCVIYAIAMADLFLWTSDDVLVISPLVADPAGSTLLIGLLVPTLLIGPPGSTCSFVDGHISSELRNLSFATIFVNHR